MILYLAHPVRADDRAGILANLERAQRWILWLAEHTPHAISVPWMPYVLALDEGRWRSRGIQDNLASLARCDGLVACGDRFTEGVHEEYAFAGVHGIPAVSLITTHGEPPRPGEECESRLRLIAQLEEQYVPLSERLLWR